MPRDRPLSFRKTPRTKTLPQTTDRIPLGKSGLEVSPFCIGMVSDPSTVPAAFDAGINFFFVTADMHWPLYEATRQGLAKLFARGRGVRDRVVVGVVSYVTQPVFCHAPFEEVIDVVRGLERIDLTIMGGSYASDLMIRFDEYRLHRAGSDGSDANGGTVKGGVRATGASFHDRRAAAHVVPAGMLDIAFTRYNVIHRGAEADLFPHVDRRSPTLLFNFLSTQGYLPPSRFTELSLSKDHWRPKVTDYYRFVLSRPELDGILCAPSTPREVRELARAFARGPLTDEELTYIRDLADLHKGEASLARV